MSASARGAWEAIVQRALLGTERASSTSSVRGATELQSAVARVDTSDAERALLASAAIVSAYDSAGRLPAHTSAEPIDPAILESEDQPSAPMRVARFLTTMLGGVNSEVLREWLGEVAARGWRVPAPLLPPLLDVGTGAGYLRELIRPVLGARGRWLAGRNEEWSWAAASAPTDDASVRIAWETGSPEERVSLLSASRARDAAQGRTLLESTWADEPPSQRAALLAVFERGLSLDDESFLERALDDRRQEVRRVAAALLRRLSGSALVARMTAMAQAALAWKAGRLLKKGEIIVAPPKEIDAAAQRDGVELKPQKGMGERAWWLAQIVAAVPPSTWSTRWGAPPETIIAAALAGDWAHPLTEGWASAAVQHRDAAWAEALLATGFPNEQPTSLAPKLDVLMHVLDVPRREAFVTRVLRGDPKSDVIIALVAAADHAWSDAFANAILGWLRKRIASASQNSMADWHLREVVPRLALRIPPLLAGATDNWPTEDDAGGFARALDRFISVLTFRRELAVELDR